MTDTEKMREAFEEWARSEKLWCGKNADNYYEDYKTKAAWKAWQAALTQTTGDVDGLQIAIEKKLCELLGRKWEPTGFSINSLCEDISQALHAQPQSVNAGLLDALKECADELEAEIESRRHGELPRRIERDLETVKRARAAISLAEAQQKEGE